MVEQKYFRGRICWPMCKRGKETKREQERKESQKDCTRVFKSCFRSQSNCGTCPQSSGPPILPHLIRICNFSLNRRLSLSLKKRSNENENLRMDWGRGTKEIWCQSFYFVPWILMSCCHISLALFLITFPRLKPPSYYLKATEIKVLCWEHKWKGGSIHHLIINDLRSTLIQLLWF